MPQTSTAQPEVQNNFGGQSPMLQKFTAWLKVRYNSSEEPEMPNKSTAHSEVAVISGIFRVGLLET